MNFKKLFAAATKQTAEHRAVDLYRDLIRKEAVIGGQLFGPLPRGHRREFFCLDEHTWVWHEEWADQAGQLQHRMTRYDVRPNGILKSQDGSGNYRAVSAVEAHRLLTAAKMYRERVGREVYNLAV